MPNEMRYVIYWSPEGRPIATVPAKDAASAMKRIPAPYNKVKGECYVLAESVVVSNHSRDFGEGCHCQICATWRRNHA